MKKILCCFVLSLMFLSSAAAEQPDQAEVTSLSGNAEVLLKDADDYTAAEEGMLLEAGDQLRTASDATAELSFNQDNSNLVRVSENTNLKVTLSGNEKLSMTDGEVFASVGKLASESAFEIRTPTAVSGARGTDWVTKITGEGTDIEAIDSIPYVKHFEADGKLSAQATLINAGQATTVRKFQKPADFRPMAISRRQQWQGIRQDVKKRAVQAMIKRQERPAFDRKDFLQKMKERKGDNFPQKDKMGKPGLMDFEKAKERPGKEIKEFKDRPAKESGKEARSVFKPLDEYTGNKNGRQGFGPLVSGQEKPRPADKADRPERAFTSGADRGSPKRDIGVKQDNNQNKPSMNKGNPPSRPGPPAGGAGKRR